MSKYNFERFFAKNVDGFWFDEEEHRYSVNGRMVPSVSSFLDSSGLKPHIPYKANGRERGKEVHRLTELYDVGMLPEDSEYKGYVEAWKLFLRETGAKILFSETMIFNERLNLAGTFDGILETNGELFIVDKKTGSLADWHKYQLAAYALIMEEPELKRYNLLLKPNGSYRVVMRADNKDIDEVRAKIEERNRMYQ
jgi:CRISPR/Cas system-associated exonuclease Cas4 (RecB family)